MNNLDDDSDEPRVWKKLGSKTPPTLHLFQPRWDRMENPRTGEVMPRLVLETPEWVNVVPITPTGEIVCVRQYRFGCAALKTEIPGGVVDPGEEPLVAARRELREETGYTAEDWTYLGRVEPNSAFLDNHCHHFLARGVRETEPQELDSGEDIQVLKLTHPELIAQVASGEIDHALVITALARVFDLRTHPVDPGPQP
ncbi:MAG: ADP-ribose pyrophosphatase [Chlamydiales bacterium]|jgi:ADP-ribose pyrophosphatase